MNDTTDTGSAAVTDTAPDTPDTEKATDPVDTTAEPDTDPVTDEVTDDTTVPVTDTDEPDDTTGEADTAGPVTIDPVVIKPDNEDKPEWLASIPSDIPEFKNIIKYYTCTYQNSGNIEEWFLSWDANIQDYEDWRSRIDSSGFRESQNVVNRYGNGKSVLDIETEETGNGVIWVSLDIARSTEVEYPDGFKDVFPTFRTTGTLMYWDDYKSEGKLKLTYQCTENWYQDLVTYKAALVTVGFTLNDSFAEKVDSGKIYRVFWDAPECKDEMLVFLY